MSAKVTIAGARVSCHMTQQELAEQMRVSRATVNYWEADKREMRPSHVKLFCMVTGFDESQLILPKKSTKSRQEGEG